MTDVVNSSKMTFLMKLIKAGHKVAGDDSTFNKDELNKRRITIERYSRIAATKKEVTYKVKQLTNMKVLLAIPKEERHLEQIILYCHGGGFSTGDLCYSSVIAGKLAISTGIRTVAHMYRLSPEYEYPSAIDDTLSMWDKLISMGYSGDNIIVAGDSAGGNLALILNKRLKDKGNPLPKAVILMSPWTDMTASSHSYDKYKDLDPILTKEYIYRARENYAGCKEDYSDPELSPIYTDFADFPPTFIQVGSNEILKDDSEVLAKRMKEAGCRVYFKEYKNSWHVFQQFPLKNAIEAYEDISLFIQKIEE